MAHDLITIRVDSAVRTRLQAVARRRGLTPSASVRLAIDAWLAGEDARSEARPYEELADLLGRVDRPPGQSRERRVAPPRSGRRGERGTR